MNPIAPSALPKLFGLFVPQSATSKSPSSKSPPPETGEAEASNVTDASKAVAYAQHQFDLGATSLMGSIAKRLPEAKTGGGEKMSAFASSDPDVTANQNKAETAA